MLTDIFPEILPINVIQEDIDKAHAIREQFRSHNYHTGVSFFYSRAESCPVSQAIKRIYQFDRVSTGVGGHITVEQDDEYAEYDLPIAGKDFIVASDNYNDSVGPIEIIAQVRHKISTRALTTN